MLPAPREHILLDEQGRWLFLFSPEDHGYLVSDAWQPTPEQELDLYLHDVGPEGLDDLSAPWRSELVRHVRERTCR